MKTKPIVVYVAIFYGHGLDYDVRVFDTFELAYKYVVERYNKEQESWAVVERTITTE